MWYVVRGSYLDRGYVYQIFSGKKTPSRDKLIAIAFGMHLSGDETQKIKSFSSNYFRVESQRIDGFVIASDKKAVFIIFSVTRWKRYMILYLST